MHLVKSSFKYLFLLTTLIYFSGCNSDVRIDLKSDTDPDTASLYLAKNNPINSQIINELILEIGETVTFFSLLSRSGESHENIPVRWSLIGSMGNLLVKTSGKEADFSSVAAGTGYIEVEDAGLTKRIKITVLENSFKANNLSFNMTQGSEKLSVLSYEAGNLAVSCSLINLVNITISTPCACDSLGDCNVGIISSPSYEGAASFEYFLSRLDGKVSETALASIVVDAITDKILYETNFDTSADWLLTGTAVWECGAQTNDIFGPPSGKSGNNICGTVLNASHNTANALAFLSSPSISLSGAINPFVYFWMAMDTPGEYGFDIGYLSVSINGGGYTKVEKTDRGFYGTGYNSENGWSGTYPMDSSWGKAGLNLFNLSTPGLVGITSNDSVSVRFTFQTDNTDQVDPGFFIDDFSIVDVLKIDGEESFPYITNFDNTNNWLATGVWECGDQTVNGPTSGHSDDSVCATGLNKTYTFNKTASHLYSPKVSLAGSTTPELNFWLNMELRDEVNFEQGNIFLSVNNSPFIMIEDGDTGFLGSVYNGNAMVNVFNITDGWTGDFPGINVWGIVRLDLLNLSTSGLTSISNTDQVQVRFSFYSDYSDAGKPGFFIDDFSIID